MNKRDGIKKRLESMRLIAHIFNFLTFYLNKQVQFCTILQKESVTMKHTFSNKSECMHVFANQPDGQDLSFTGNVFSSCSIPIAKIIDVKKKRVLISTRRYLVPISSHISGISSAMSHYDRLYVYLVDPVHYSEHIRNIQDLFDCYITMLDKNKRSLKFEFFTEAINYLRTAKTYCEWFHIKSKLSRKLRRFIDINYNVLQYLKEKKLIEISEREERLNSPEHIAKLKKKYEIQIAELTSAIEIWNAKYPDWINEWKNHESDDIPYYFPYYQYPKIAFKYCEIRPLYQIVYISYLRLNEDKTRVETTSGAQVLTQHAVKIWPVIQRSYREQSVHPGNGFKIDYHEVTRIDKGDLLIGCHNIKYNEIESIAKQLNLI